MNKKVLLLIATILTFQEVYSGPSHSIVCPIKAWSGDLGMWTDKGQLINKINFTDNGSAGYVLWVQTADGEYYQNVGTEITDKTKILYSTILAAKSNGSYVNFRYCWDGSAYNFDAVTVTN